MLGHLRPKTQNLEYRSVYSHCCKLQRQLFGLTSLPALSYDAVFVYAATSEMTRSQDLAKLPQQKCCRLGRLPNEHNKEVGEAALSLGMLMWAEKLQDDIQDSKSIPSRLLYYFTRRKIKRAGQILGNHFPALTAAIEEFRVDQTSIERSNNTSLIDFVLPTVKLYEQAALCFRDFFREPEVFKSFTRVMGRVGAAVLLADAAFDWQLDQRSRNYNPCCSDEAAKSALVAAQRNIRVASFEFSESSLTHWILRSVHDQFFFVAQRHNPNWLAGQSLQCIAPNPEPSHVTLYATCCIPCGDGAVAADSKECGTAFCGCICCCYCCATNVCGNGV